jgi:hypothetical protein
LLTAALSTASLARGAPLVAALTLPTRNADAQALARIADGVAEALARKTGGRVAALPPASDLDLAQRLERARRLADHGAVDEAALTFDAVLERAAVAGAPAGEGPLLVTASVERAAIALARGEPRRAEALLSRLLRDDPTFTLLHQEESPRLRAAFEAVRQRLGAEPAITAADVAQACGAGPEVLLVVRLRQAGLKESIEVVRFDRCRIVARVVAPTADGPAEIADRLLPASSPPPLPSTPPPRRTRWAPWALVAGGALIAVTGAILVGVAEGERERVAATSCGMARTCDPASYRSWALAQDAGWGVLAAGGVVLGGGIVWGLVDRRGHSGAAHAQARR